MSTFTPRDAREHEACKFEYPKFNIGDRVVVRGWAGKPDRQGTITEINLRTVCWPTWRYEVDHGQQQIDWTDLSPAG